MSSTQFVHAVQEKRLVRWHDNGFLRTLEPHLFAQVGGGRDVLIAFQIAGGPAGDQQHCWKLIDISEGVEIAGAERFAGRREIPAHLRQLVRATYASAPASCTPGACCGSAVPRR